ncbi:MAG: diadenylate cyclase [Acidimicrobiia bacterium]|nr:diadenylate cyclase [Acidimicrobiia bacterium]MDH5519525.1 diadenylate cyclase [Acidimicrobiia bacterium]
MPGVKADDGVRASLGPTVTSTAGSGAAAEAGRVRRLREELDELDPAILAGLDDPNALLEELAYAIRPRIHERRVPSYGAIVRPAFKSKRWSEGTRINLAHRRVEDLADAAVRRFADGVTSFVVRGSAGVNDLVVFDRSVGSERDLTIVAEASGATVVQRHPSGVVRAAGPFGVLRLLGFDWQLEPPVSRWLDLGVCAVKPLSHEVLKRMLRFAIHDVAARNVGATFVVTPGGELNGGVEQRYGRPPDFQIARPSDLAPLYHVLGQIDGAAVFDHTGMLTELGVRLIPSVAAEAEVEALGGTRHTSALRYSYDDPQATLIVISEDGPVSVMRAGKRLGHSS